VANKRNQPARVGERPPPGGRTIEDTIAEARAAAEDLRAAKREANEARADLKQTMAEVRELLPQLTHDAVEERLKAHAGAEMARMADEVKAVVGKVHDDVRRHLDKLLDTYLTGEQDEPSLPELVAAHQRLRKSHEAVARDRASSGGTP
jgi:DNA repair exonuclease SbcCD ATPase subunit